MDNEELIAHVKQYSADKGWPCKSDNDVFETLVDAGKPVYSSVTSSHRWYDSVFRVVELGEVEGQPKLIGFTDAKTTGDDSPRDIGWEFDMDSICEVEEKTKTVTYYEAH